MKEHSVILFDLSIRWIALYILLHAITFSMYGIDKIKAKKHKRRIAEKTLLAFAFFAPLGALFGMLLFRHKTKKTYFYLVCIISVLLHFSLLFILSFF